MPTVVKDFTVPQKGIGKPDYFVPYRTEIEPTRQTPWNIAFDDFPLPAETTFVLDELYTVPEGKKLVIGYIKGTSSIDCIWGSSMLKNGVAFCPLFHPQMTIVPLPDTSGFVFDAGDILGARFENPLDVVLLLRGDVSGFLYEFEA